MNFQFILWPVNQTILWATHKDPLLQEKLIFLVSPFADIIHIEFYELPRVWVLLYWLQLILSKEQSDNDSKQRATHDLELLVERF